MKGGRWWIWTVIPGGGAGNLLASLAPGWERYTASRVGQALAKHLNLPIVVIEARTRREAENALDIAPVQGEATFANPTLVHHGMINAASHHLLEDPGGSAVPLPLADLYSFRQKDAERVAQALSSGLRKRVMLLDNSGLPGALHHHPALDVGPLARRQRRLGNPAGLPVRGEVWTTVLGGRFKVLDATPTTVQGRHLDSGNREWIERGEFLATYKPPRQRNPRRAHAVTVAQAARELNAHHLRYSAGFYGMGSRWFGARVRAGQLQVWDFDNWTNAPAGTGFHDHNGQPLLVVPGAEPEGNPSRSLRAKISRSYGRLERSRKQRRAKARVRSGKASFAQFEHEIERHDVRRILQTGSSQARAYRSAQPPGYGERGRGRVWNPRADRPGNDRDFAAKTIRDALKRRSGHAWSVTVGRGTAWGWIGVTLPPSRRTWRHRLKPDMPDWPENYEGYDSGQPGGGMSPDQRAELAGLLGLEVNEVHGDGISIPGGFDYYDEYMDRAQGRTPERLGKPYWDNPRERPPVTGEIARIMAEVDRDRARDLRRTAARKGIKPKSLWLEMTGLHPIPKPNARGGPRIVFNRLLGGWYVVVGPHQTPLNGRFNSKAEAQAWLEGGPARRTPNPKGRAVIDSEWKARREARRKWGRGAQVWSGGVVGNKTFVVGVLTHAGSAFQAIGSGDSWEAAFTDAKGKRRPKPNPKGLLSVPEQHQLKIARATLKMNDVFTRIMGGMSKDEARELIYRLTGERPAENPRSPFQVGERVTVPYSGRLSYFGRKVIRTREHATIQGVNDDGTALVMVKRGQAAEQHAFPLAQIRRLPQRGVKATGARVGRAKARLELKDLRARQRGATAEVGRLASEAECLEARAKLMDPESPEFRNATARLGRLLTVLDAERMIAGELERADPSYADPFALPMPARLVANPKGRKNPAGEAWAVFGGKYVLEEQAPQTYKNLGHVRLFIATGKRGATYGATLYEDGRFVWMNLAMRNNNVPFDLAQVSPARLIEGATRTNPRSSEVAKARAMFERWNSDAAPRAPRTSRVRVPAQPRALARLGELVSVTYRSDKFAGTTDNPDGRQQLYEHATKRPRPVLASDSDGHVHIVGGRMRPTADGLIN